MTIDDQINDEKIKYDINREAAKASVLSSDKTNNYQYFAGEEIQPSDQKEIIEETKFTYSFLRKTVEKQKEKQVLALRLLNIFSKTN